MGKSELGFGMDCLWLILLGLSDLSAGNNTLFEGGGLPESQILIAGKVGAAVGLDDEMQKMGGNPALSRRALADGVLLTWTGYGELKPKLETPFAATVNPCTLNGNATLKLGRRR